MKKAAESKVSNLFIKKAYSVAVAIIAGSFLYTRLKSTSSVADLVTVRGFSKAEDSARHDVSNTLYKNEPYWFFGAILSWFHKLP